MSSEDFDFIAFYEGHEISLKPGKSKPTKADLQELLGSLWMLSQMADDIQTIDSQCDIMKTLTPEIPELADLSKKSPQRRIGFAGIKNAIEPYVLGRNELK